MSQVVIVTGASAGIGAACADQLHRTGWTVFGASRRATSTAAWTPLRMDVDSEASVTDGVAQVLERHGRVDAVVACAGWGLAGAAEVTTEEEAKAQVETLFWGSVRLVRAVLPAMRAGGGGRVVLMGSIGGVIGLPFQSFYSASKFALEGWAEAVAHEVAPFGIDVTVVEPGNIRTDFTAARQLVAAAGTDVYRAASDRAIDKMAADEAQGAGPTTVAHTVGRVLVARRPPRRVSVGRPGERFGLVAKRALPYRAFEAASRDALGVERPPRRR
jgi:NAD(P)-dependent dehydrogenase (short-subunit alcohol dehydrogenase family)